MATKASTPTAAQNWQDALERYEHAENRLAGWLMAANTGGAAAVLSLMGGFVNKSPVVIPQLLALLLTLFLIGIFGACMALTADLMLKSKVLNLVKAGVKELYKQDASWLQSVDRVRRYALSISSLFLFAGAGIGLWNIWSFTG